MAFPQVSRPHFPPGYLEAPKSYLPWEQVQQQLIAAIHYWLCTVQPNGYPHAVPKWGVWVAGRFYFDGSLETKHARNIAKNSAVTVHLESGEKPVIVNGRCNVLARPETPLAEKVAAEYSRKYRELGYAPEPQQWENGGLFEVIPQSVLAWTNFTENPTRFTFPVEF